MDKPYLDNFCTGNSCDCGVHESKEGRRAVRDPWRIQSKCLSIYISIIQFYTLRGLRSSRTRDRTQYSKTLYHTGGRGGSVRSKRRTEESLIGVVRSVKRAVQPTTDRTRVKPWNIAVLVYDVRRWNKNHTIETIVQHFLYVHLAVILSLLYVLPTK